MVDTDVIGVGAGAAGLAAAGHLADAGVHAIVLEARERIGGRVRGYDRLMEHLAAAVSVVRESPVVTITWSDDGVSVEAGRAYTGRAAIVTVPLGLLKAGVLRFVPSLPVAIQEAIDTLTMHPGMKVLLRFREPLWPAGTSYVVVDDHVPVVWPPRDGAGVLLAFVMGSRAEALREAPGPVERVLSALAAVWGDEPRRTLVAVDVVDWDADPWTRGGIRLRHPAPPTCAMSWRNSAEGCCWPARRPTTPGRARSAGHCARAYGRPLRRSRPSAEHGYGSALERPCA